MINSPILTLLRYKCRSIICRPLFWVLFPAVVLLTASFWPLLMWKNLWFISNLVEVFRGEKLGSL